MGNIVFWVKAFMIVLSVLSGKDEASMNQDHATNDHAETKQIVALMKNRLENQVYFSRSDMLAINAYMDKKNDNPDVKEIKKDISEIYTGLALDHQVARLNKTEVQKNVYDFYLESIIKVEEKLKDK
ncbi:hypothetical protein [Saccharibacillus qingshengii]|uniref:hypothetical protein n=1 Tax=Saccharibacillus qingshengii TaxID=1763540 RepID=UPI001551B539|nr:hypothetical protein [Saccharibacillus qingshengii]